MATGAPLWEQSKENAAPLERGRNVAVLERSLAAISNDDERREQERMIRHYERLVASTTTSSVNDFDSNKESEASSSAATQDDDPLVHWLSYIKFHQEAFPADTNAQFLLLERCFRALCTDHKYANDPRFLRICCMYAEKTNRAPEIFNYLYGQKIGVHVAIFWVAWAFVAEKGGDFAFAEKILEKGIRKAAQPIKYLLQRQKQFQRRMSRHWLNSANAQQDDIDDENDENAGRRRGVLGGLSEVSIRHNDRSRIGAPSTNHRRGGAVLNTATFVDRTARASSAATASGYNNSNHDSSGFAILADDGTEYQGSSEILLEQSFLSHHDRVLEREQDRLKENRLATERWNERGALTNRSIYIVPKVPRTLTPVTFAVYVDAECSAQHEREEAERQKQAEQHRRLRDDRTTFRQLETSGVAEKLTNDPLRYVRNPAQLKMDQAQAEEARSSEVRSSVSNKNQSNSKKVYLNRGFNSRLLKSDTGHEQSFEEARIKAGYFTLVKNSTNVNLFAQTNSRNADDSYMSMDTGSFMDGSLEIVSMDDTQQSMDRKLGTSQQSKRVRKMAPTPRNASTASSTVDEYAPVGVAPGNEEQTINTQLAIKELSIMFFSPAFPLQDESRQNERSGGLGPILNESGVSEAAATANYGSPNSEDGNYATQGSIAELVAYGNPNGSFAAVHDDVENEGGDRNPLSRSMTTPGFDTMALRTLEDRPTQSRPSCSSTHQRRVLGPVAQEDPLRALPAVEFNPQAGFQIYSDSDGLATNMERSSTHEQNSSTTPGSSAIRLDDVAYETVPATGAVRSASYFQIYQDEPGSAANETQVAVDVSGDTATFSLLGDAFEMLAATSPNSGSDCSSPSSEASVASQKRRFNDSPSDNACVGTTSQVHLLDNATQTTQFVDLKALDYLELHAEDIKSAILRMKREAIGHLPLSVDLVDILCQKNLVCDLQNHTLPRSFKLNQDLKGMEINFGHSCARVKQELGRGAYGVVALLDRDEHGGVAVKVQCPMGCLAHEFDIMRVLEKRVDRTDMASGGFPRALALLSFADGALLTMTAASMSGLNLIDLTNLYTTLEKTIPEEVVLYYAGRMLGHIETLHKKAKILHCDVKPDNWVLAKSNAVGKQCIEGSELVLVDYGRAIDLASVEKRPEIDNQTPLCTKFTGPASLDSMMCVAMRKGLPWYFDVDTYGICASVHVLLFGCHLDIAVNRQNCWMPRESTRGCLYAEIWNKLFNTLLNLDNVTKSSTGSRPNSLRQLRNRIKECLATKQEILVAALKYQAAILPSKR